MAALEIYEPMCETENCGARATRRLRTDAGTLHFYCTRHSTPALIAANKVEREKAAKPLREAK